MQLAIRNYFCVCFSSFDKDVSVHHESAAEDIMEYVALDVIENTFDSLLDTICENAQHEHLTSKNINEV